MKDIAIYGAGGFGRETALLIQQINSVSPTWRVVGFFDDGLEKGATVDGLTVLGGSAEVKSYKGSMVIAIAEPRTRNSIVNRLMGSSDLVFPILVHPNAQLGSAVYNKIARGCIITAGVILTTHVTLNEFCIVNLASTIGHDVKIGSCTTIMPGCSISGSVSIGEGCLLGTGSRTLQNISIGDASVIGAGAVVTKSCPPNSKLIGVPAKEIKK